MNEALKEVIDTLTAERYGPSLWWKAPPSPPRRRHLEGVAEDSEFECARRRRELAEAYEPMREAL